MTADGLDLPAWIQAVGSVAGIFWAVYVARKDRNDRAAKEAQGEEVQGRALAITLVPMLETLRDQLELTVRSGDIKRDPDGSLPLVSVPLATRNISDFGVSVLGQYIDKVHILRDGCGMRILAAYVKLKSVLQVAARVQGRTLEMIAISRPVIPREEFDPEAILPLINSILEQLYAIQEAVDFKHVEQRRTNGWLRRHR